MGIGWIIFISIISVLALLLVTPIKVYITYNSENNKNEVFLRYSFLKKQIVPEVERYINLNDYKIKKFKKANKGFFSKKEKKSEEKSDKKNSLKDILEFNRVLTAEQKKLIKNFVIWFIKRILKLIRLIINKLNISVSSDDVSKTAVMYGAVSQAVSYLLNLIFNIGNVKTIGKDNVKVYADFCSEKTKLDIDICLSILPVSVICLGIVGLIKVYNIYRKGNNGKRQNENNGDEQTENTNISNNEIGGTNDAGQQD